MKKRAQPAEPSVDGSSAPNERWAYKILVNHAEHPVELKRLAFQQELQTLLKENWSPTDIGRLGIDEKTRLATGKTTLLRKRVPFHAPLTTEEQLVVIELLAARMLMDIRFLPPEFATDSRVKRVVTSNGITVFFQLHYLRNDLRLHVFIPIKTLQGTKGSDLVMVDSRVKGARPVAGTALNSVAAKPSTVTYWYLDEVLRLREDQKLFTVAHSGEQYAKPEVLTVRGSSDPAVQMLWLHHQNIGVIPPSFLLARKTMKRENTKDFFAWLDSQLKELSTEIFHCTDDP